MQLISAQTPSDAGGGTGLSQARQDSPSILDARHQAGRSVATAASNSIGFCSTVRSATGPYRVARLWPKVVRSMSGALLRRTAARPKTSPRLVLSRAAWNRCPGSAFATPYAVGCTACTGSNGDPGAERLKESVHSKPPSSIVVSPDHRNPRLWHHHNLADLVTREHGGIGDWEFGKRIRRASNNT